MEKRNKRKPTPFGKAIKKGLVDKEMTQEELAQLIGSSPAYVRLIIYGKRSGAKYRSAIADTLHLDKKWCAESASQYKGA